MEPRLRIYLTGGLALSYGGTVVGPESFPGRQGRLAFAYLALAHRRPVLREELARILWADEWPQATQSALNAIVSKSRQALRLLCVDDVSIVGGPGWYQLRLPDAIWIDFEAAISSLHEAEAIVRAGDLISAHGAAAVAFHITGRPFLPGEEGEWVQQRRRQLRDVRVRALECMSHAYLANGEPSVAADLCRQAIELEPYRETLYQQLMRACVAAGNRAEALRVYEHCRGIIADELGVDPSQETQAIYLQVLTSA